MRTKMMNRTLNTGLAVLLSMCMLSTTAFAYEGGTAAKSVQNAALQSAEYTLDMDAFGDTHAAAKNGTLTPAAGHHTPQTAKYLSEADMNTGLSQSVSVNPDWYYVELTDTNKLSTVFYQQIHDGQYTLSYYKLDQNTGELTELATSARIHTYQRIIHMDTAGFYFMKMEPVVAPTTSYPYHFIVCPSYDYDSYEQNDYLELAPSFTDSMDVYANIDNMLDEDYYQLNLTDDKTIHVDFTGTQNQAYALEIYKDVNGALSPVGSIYSDAPTASFQCSSGAYYLYVRSQQGTYSAADYYHVSVN